jgi:hypothetical protein
MHWNLYQYFQLAALFAALLCYKGLRQYAIALFIPLLLVINATEIIANNYQSLGMERNYGVYNGYLLLSTPLWMLLYSRMLALKGAARRIFGGIIVCTCLLLLLNFLLLQGMYVFNTYSLLLVMLANIILSALVLFKLATDEEIQYSPVRHPYFWINAGNLLFSIVSLVLLGLQHYIFANRIQIGNMTLYRAILPGANIILYIAFSYSFYLCQQRKVKLSLSL